MATKVQVTKMTFDDWHSDIAFFHFRSNEMAGMMKCFCCNGKGCVFCKNTGYIKPNDERMPAIIAYMGTAARIKEESEAKAKQLADEHEKNKASALAKLTPEELEALGLKKV